MIPPDLLSRSLVVGAVPDQLVAIPEPLLDALLAGRRADEEARTWGEFREAAPGLHRLLASADPDLPADDEPFSSLADDDAFPHANTLMLEWVPADLQEALGETASDTHGDAWFDIAIDGPEDAEAIGEAVRLFEEAGYTVRRDDAAICTACGY